MVKNSAWSRVGQERDVVIDEIALQILRHGDVVLDQRRMQPSQKRGLPACAREIVDIPAVLTVHAMRDAR